MKYTCTGVGTQQAQLPATDDPHPTPTLTAGLTCDVYGGLAVLKLDGPGAEGFYDVDALAAWLMQAGGSASAGSSSSSSGGADDEGAGPGPGSEQGQGQGHSKRGGGHRDLLPSPITTVYLKFRAGSEERGRLVAGQPPDRQEVFTENGARFGVGWVGCWWAAPGLGSLGLGSGDRALGTGPVGVGMGVGLRGRSVAYVPLCP